MSSTSSDITLLTEQLAIHRKEIAAVYEELVSLDLEDGDDLFTFHATLENPVLTRPGNFLAMLRHQHLLLMAKHSSCQSLRSPPSMEMSCTGEQFSVSVHECSNLSDVEKLVYLQ